MKSFNILIGGKLGDFLLTLYGVKGICENRNVKANIYLIDIGWEFGIENTYKELYPIITQQNYINDFQILTDYELDPEQTPQKNSPIKVYNKILKEQGYVVDNYLRSPFLYRKCWSKIYSNLFNFPLKSYDPLLQYDSFNPQFEGKVLIHRKFARDRMNPDFPWDLFLSEYKGNMIFVSSNKEDYDQFPHKDAMDYVEIKTLHDWFTAINSCSMFISNLTAPIVMARILNKTLIAELPLNGDFFHWIGEEEFSPNIHWFLTDQINNFLTHTPHDTELQTNSRWSYKTN